MESILFLLSNIRLCCVQISDKAHDIAFFVLLSCAQDKCFANSNYVMGGPMDTIQLLFNSLLVDIHPSGTSRKAIVPHKMRRRWLDTWKKKKNSRWTNNKWKNGTKSGGKEEKIDSKIQLSKWKKKSKYLKFRETSFELKIPQCTKVFLNCSTKEENTWEKSVSKQQLLGERRWNKRN